MIHHFNDSSFVNFPIVLKSLKLNDFFLSQLEHLFNLKFAAKDLERNSKKCEKEEKAEKLKCKKAIQKGNIEGAKIHCENAIRQKNQALNYLRMSARVDAGKLRIRFNKIDQNFNFSNHQF